MILTAEADAAGAFPFMIGDIDPKRGYVHVLDDTSLDVVMRECDTITDFVGYLTAKELFVRSGRFGFAAGEEELLAYYKADVNDRGEHHFPVPQGDAKIGLPEGLYSEYLASGERRRKVEADKISYAWDGLIEKFSAHVLSGTSYEGGGQPVEYHERGLRYLAAEPRLRRRHLATQLLAFLEKRKSGRFDYAARLVRTTSPGHPDFVFFIVRRRAEMQEGDYRQLRRWLLLQYCRVVRLKNPDASVIVGLAFEPLDAPGFSEDLIVYHGAGFDEDERAEAEEAERELGFLSNPEMSRFSVREYPPEEPATPSAATPGAAKRYPGPSRNDRCPCGSGRKYKKCCGK